MLRKSCCGISLGVNPLRLTFQHVASAIRERELCYHDHGEKAPLTGLQPVLAHGLRYHLMNHTYERV